MADAKKPEPAPPVSSSTGDPFVDIVWILITILVIIYVVNGILSIFNSAAGRIGSIGEIPTRSIPLSEAPSLIGDRVETTKETVVLDSPGGKEVGRKPAGMEAVILEGPIIKDGIKYWHVRFSDGTDGWVDENSLDHVDTQKTPLSNVDDAKVGDDVSISSGSAKVLSEPGGQEIANKTLNSKGKIIDGPEEKEGKKYWKVKFEDGTEGWVAEDDLDYVTIKKTPLSKMETMLGKQVVASRNGVTVHDAPGGKVVGTEKRGSSGKIIEGPIIKNGERWWHVEFENGTKGWVRESDLLYVQGEDSWFTKTKNAIIGFISAIKVLSILLSALLVGWAVYLYRKIDKLRKNEAESLYVIPPAVEEPVNPAWSRVEQYVNGSTDNDWRLAILEADIILSDMLDKMQLPGETIGDKLKAVERSDFRTVDSAWEAHKVRNRIAHEGATFQLSQHEAKRVIDLYRSVFEEFRVI